MTSKKTIRLISLVMQARHISFHRAKTVYAYLANGKPTFANSPPSESEKRYFAVSPDGRVRQVNGDEDLVPPMTTGLLEKMSSGGIKPFDVRPMTDSWLAVVLQVRAWEQKRNAQFKTRRRREESNEETVQVESVSSEVSVDIPRGEDVVDSSRAIPR